MLVVCKLIKTSLGAGERLINPPSLAGKGGRGIRFARIHRFYFSLEIEGFIPCFN